MVGFVSRFLLFEHFRIGRGIYLLLYIEIAVRVPEAKIRLHAYTNRYSVCMVLWVLLFI